MGQRTADRAAVSHLLVGDQPGRPREHAELRRSGDGRVGSERADAGVAVVLLHAMEPGHAAQVDQEGRSRQPQLHQRQQRMAAGQDLGILAVLVESPYHLLE